MKFQETYWGGVSFFQGKNVNGKALKNFLKIAPLCTICSMKMQPNQTKMADFLCWQGTLCQYRSVLGTVKTFVMTPKDSEVSPFVTSLHDNIHHDFMKITTKLVNYWKFWTPSPTKTTADLETPYPSFWVIGVSGLGGLVCVLQCMINDHWSCTTYIFGNYLFLMYNTSWAVWQAFLKCMILDIVEANRDGDARI